MRKLLHYLLIHPLAALLLVVLLLLVTLALLASSSSGTRILASNLQHIVPGLELAGVDGALLQGIHLQRLHWQDDTTQVEAEGVRISNRLEIGTPATLRVDELHVDKLTLHLQGSGQEDAADEEPFDLPTILLPFNVDMQQARIGSIEIWQDGKLLPVWRNVTAHGHTRDGRLQLDSLQTQVDDGQGQATLIVDGNMGLARPHPLDVNLAVDSTNPVWGLGKGKAHLGGELQQYELSIDVDWQYAAYPRYQGHLQGKGTLANLVVNSLQLEGAAGKVTGKGTLGWQDGFSWQADLNGTALNPAPFVKDMPAQLDASLVSSGTWRDGKPNLTLEVSKLQGKLRDYPVDVKGKGAWDGKLLALQSLDAWVGGNHAELSGQASEPFDLRWKVDARNLAEVWRGLEGGVKGEGILKGTLAKPVIQADLQGSKLRYQDFRLGSLELKATQEGERYNLKGVLQAFKNGNNELKSATLDGQGSIDNHRLVAQLVHADGKADFTANGGWKDGAWQGSVQNLSLRDTPAGNWNMAGAVNLAASASAFSSSDICLSNPAGAKVCGKPAWAQREGFSINGTLQQFPLVMLKTWLPDTISLPGSANAEYRFAQSGGKPVAKLSLRLPDSSLGLHDGKGKTETLQYANAKAELDLHDRQADVQASLDLLKRGTLRANGQVTLSPQDGPHRLNANIKVDVPDIGWLEQFSTQIDQLKGQVGGDVQVSGLLASPNITGSARLSNGQVHLPEAGVTLDAITLTMQADGADRANLVGTLRAGQGTLNATGVLSLANLPNWQADVKLTGNNLRLMDTHEIQALVSPNLHIQASPVDVNITGVVQVPETTVSLREFPASAKVRSGDVVIVGRNATRQATTLLVKETPLNINPDVSIELGDKVQFTGFGLDARLTGKLRVLRTRQDIVAQGVLNVEGGTYKAYGQNLQIERGRLLFNGPVDNPGLDVRAVREVEDGDIQVGMELAGTVKRPESTLFSSPQQSQSDTLSYLLTGRAMSTVSGDQSSLLMDAITGLGIAGGEGLARQIGGNLGLDEVGLKAKNGSFEQSELSLGKRLGPRLYVRYIVSLFDSLQRVAITYQINKRLQVQAETGIQQGVDLIYKIDTNKGPLGP
ncbi:MAG: translocation/assembly module TamB domain-containing protein [Candidatus Thiothrix moscowensis]|nr:translocation/assembly module TamB domain-containing protein [Candidatus Thiothrix moscowensis]